MVYLWDRATRGFSPLCGMRPTSSSHKHFHTTFSDQFYHISYSRNVIAKQYGMHTPFLTNIKKYMPDILANKWSSATNSTMNIALQLQLLCTDD